MRTVEPISGDVRVAGDGPAAIPEERPRAGVENHVQVMMTRVGLIIPRSVGFTDWKRAGSQLNELTSAYSWCLGDWLVYGKKNYADRYVVAIRAAGLQYQTLRNYAWVARRFEMSRRRGNLTFQHHAEVASLPVDEQERWLDLAELDAWTSKKLRLELRQQRHREAVPDARLPDTPHGISVPDHRVVLWRRAADEVGEEFENWIVSNLNEAASHVLGDQYEQSGSDDGQLCREDIG